MRRVSALLSLSILVAVALAASSCGGNHQAATSGKVPSTLRGTSRGVVFRLVQAVPVNLQNGQHLSVWRLSVDFTPASRAAREQLQRADRHEELAVFCHSRSTSTAISPVPLHAGAIQIPGEVSFVDYNPARTVCGFWHAELQPHRVLLSAKMHRV
jgi:hypothetical protein